MRTPSVAPILPTRLNAAFIETAFAGTAFSGQRRGRGAGRKAPEEPPVSVLMGRC